MNKAQIERLTQLVLAAQGRPTKRPLKEIILAEKTVAAKYTPRLPTTKQLQAPTEEV